VTSEFASTAGDDVLLRSVLRAWGRGLWVDESGFVQWRQFPLFSGMEEKAQPIIIAKPAMSRRRV